MAQKYWMIVASYDHVQRGVAESFAQACHGKAGPLNKMQAGDGVIYYSPKQRFGGTEPCQSFTALGWVQAGAAYQVDMGGGFFPYRRGIAFESCQQAPIRPLISQLHFIQNPSKWGYIFRRGHFEISAEDFQCIAQAMGVKVA